MALVGSVAAAVLCLGGFGAVVAGAGPGDPLYGLHTMLFGEEQQTRTDQVALASQQLAEVQQLIDEGQWDAAQDKLQTLTTTVATVNDVEQKQELVTQWQDLTVKVDAKDANATLPPGAPPPPMPEPVVVAPGSDTRRRVDNARRRRRAAPRRHRRRPPPRRPTTTSSAATSTPTSSSPVPEPPPPSGTPTTTTPPTSPPTTTTTTTTTHGGHDDHHHVAGRCPGRGSAVPAVAPPSRPRRPSGRAADRGRAAASAPSGSVAPPMRATAPHDCAARRRRRRRSHLRGAAAARAREPGYGKPGDGDQPGHDDHAGYATAQEARRRRIERFSPQRYPSESDVASLSDASA